MYCLYIIIYRLDVKFCKYALSMARLDRGIFGSMDFIVELMAAGRELDSDSVES